MKSKSFSFFASVLSAVVLLSLPLAARAQSLTAIHAFGALVSNTNQDGANPHAELTLSGNTLYGTAQNGGSHGSGTIFRVNTDGSDFTNLYNFTAVSSGTNGDGEFPQGGLVLSGNTLYGTARNAGSMSGGTLFAINIDGTGFTNLHNFIYAGGSLPYGTLALSGTTLYGTASIGGSSLGGTVFKINTDGSGYTNFYNFATGISTGSEPIAGLRLVGDTLYGTTYGGGSSNTGTVFGINTNGSNFTDLYSFGEDIALNFGYENAVGANPDAGVVLSGGSLYGTTIYGGTGGVGVIYAINTNSMVFTNLHSFATGYTNSSGAFTNSDGAETYDTLLLSGSALYGTAPLGGLGPGTIFKINTDGGGFATLYSFSVPTANASHVRTNSDGIGPYGGLVTSGGSFYGTTAFGGTNGEGVVYALTLSSNPAPPLLSGRFSGSSLIITWTNAGTSLQAAPTIAGTFTNVPGANSPYTNFLKGSQGYFRLLSD